MAGCLHSFVRRGYYGGRSEVFIERFNGPGLLNYCDFNSMYPSEMREPMPTQLAKDVKGAIDIERYSRHYIGFVEADVYIPDSCTIPPLPTRYNGRLVFPVGNLSGVWSSVELALVRECGGYIRDVRRSVWFVGKPIFGPFVDYWYSYRDKSSAKYDATIALVAKLMLNSLYGKMGMSEERERIWLFPSHEDIDQHELTPIGDPSSEVFVEKVTVDAPYIIPHISAWVTALARVKLWRTMQQYIRKGHAIYYCDTDSLITDGPCNDSKKLGDLKVECKIEAAHFVAPKLYWVREPDSERPDDITDEEWSKKRDHVKAKGFGGFGRSGLTYKEFLRVVNHRRKVKLTKLTKLREGLAKGEMTRKKIVNKGISTLDSKRVHLPDGRTIPLEI